MKKTEMTLFIDNQVDRLDLDAALAGVSKQRRLHALSYRSEHDRRLSVAAYMLLQRALRVEYGIDEPTLFDFGINGKPSLVGHSGIFFSLSHCHEAAACAVDSSPVGVDVESIGHYDEEIAGKVMNREEQRLIASSSDPQLTFTRLWTMKESLLKMTGEGLTDDMRNILDIPDKPFRFQTTVFSQFVCTVCYKL